MPLDYATRLLDLYGPNPVPSAEPAAAPAPAPELTSEQLAELQRQLLLAQSSAQNYATDLQYNPATPQPPGLLPGYDHAQARAAHNAMLSGQPAPVPAYNGPTLMDLKRLEQAQQQAQAQLYAASRP